MQEKSVTKIVGSYIPLLQFDILHCQWKNWNVKEDKDKYKIHVLHVLQLVKGKFQDKVTSSSEENKLVAVSIVEFHLAEGIS